MVEVRGFRVVRFFLFRLEEGFCKVSIRHHLAFPLRILGDLDHGVHFKCRIIVLVFVFYVMVRGHCNLSRRCTFRLPYIPSHTQEAL